MRLIESAEAIAELPIGSVLRSHNGVAVLNQDGWIVSGYIYPRTHDDVEEYIGAYPIELIYDGAPDDATISIPTPNVPYGPHGVAPRIATADYLDRVLSKIQKVDTSPDGWSSHRHIHIGGSNVTATVERLLADVAAALREAEADR